MTAPRTFWNRLSHYFRAEDGLEMHAHGNGAVKRANGLDVSLARDERGEAQNGKHDPQPRGGIEIEPSGPRSEPQTWWRRRQRRELLQRETSQRVIELMDAMQSHFQRQDQRGDQLVVSMTSVAGVLADLAQNQKDQSESIRQIAAQVHIAGRHTEILADSLSRVPQALHTQAETLRAIGQRIESAKETDIELNQSLRSFGQALDALRNASSTQADALQQLHTGEQKQREEMGGLVRNQNRLLLGGIIVAGTLGLAALGLAIWLQVGTQF